ncbi:MAG: Ig-like domain-containing protein [Oscillospiraceae bacterium]|nr:Ig-like domain-containing protein [Oscillospiraceae bacterium]
MNTRHFITRALAIFLAILMLVSSVPPTAFAVEADEAYLESGYDTTSEVPAPPEYPPYPEVPSLPEEPSLPEYPSLPEHPTLPEYPLLPDDEEDYEDDEDEEELPLLPEPSPTPIPPVLPELPSLPTVSAFPTVVLEGGRANAIVGEDIVAMSRTTIMQGGTMLVPVEPIFALVGAEIMFDGRIFTAQLDERRIMLEAGSTILRIWEGRQPQEDFAIPPLEEINLVLYAPLEVVVMALGGYIESVLLGGQHFAIVSPHELYPSEALELAEAAQAQLHELRVVSDAVRRMTPMPAVAFGSVVVQDGAWRALVDEVNIVMTNPIFSVDGALFAPMDGISQMLGAATSFSSPTLSITMGNQRFEMDVGSVTIRQWMNGVRQPDTTIEAVLGGAHPVEPVRIVNGVVYAPLRLLTNLLGGHIMWLDYPPPGTGPGFAVITMFPISNAEAYRLVREAQRRLHPSYVPTQGIAVSPSSTQLVLDNGEVDGVRQLTATVLPTNATDQSVRWTSSNTNIATVSSNGFVTPHATGTVFITAHAADNGVSSSSTVTVVERASSVTLNQTNVTLGIQGTVTEEFTFVGTVWSAQATNRDIRWTTSDPNIAFVYQDGRVRAVNPGTATITAHVDGSRIPVNTSATVVVRRLATDIFLEPTALTLHMTGPISETEQIARTVFPTDAFNANNIVWTTSNPAVATVDQNGNVTSAGVGTATIRATVQGSTNVWAEATVTVFNLATAVELNQSSITLIIEGDQFGERQLLETVLPLDAINRDVTWSSSDPDIATVDQYGIGDSGKCRNCDHHRDSQRDNPYRDLHRKCSRDPDWDHAQLHGADADDKQSGPEFCLAPSDSRRGIGPRRNHHLVVG